MIVEKEVIIRNKQGLHARPAAVFVQIANKYESDVIVRKDNEEVNGKSIMGVLMLGAEEGSVVLIKAKGVDAKEAVEELERILLQQIKDIATSQIDKGKRKRNI